MLVVPPAVGRPQSRAISTFVSEAQHEVAMRRSVCRGGPAPPQSPFVSRDMLCGFRGWYRATLLTNPSSGTVSERPLLNHRTNFGFDGDEFYTQPVQRTGSLAFGQARPSWRVAVGFRKLGRSPLVGARYGLGVGGRCCAHPPLAEDRSELLTHIRDDVQSLPTGGLRRRKLKARVKEGRELVIGWSDHIGAALVEVDGYCCPGAEV